MDFFKDVFDGINLQDQNGGSLQNESFFENVPK